MTAARTETFYPPNTQGHQIMMTTFGRFARPLQRAGFRKTWDGRFGGTRVIEWRREEPDGRTLICQIWEDGGHRITHEWLGCSDTRPTEFTTETALTSAIEREATRTDGRYRNPNNHHAPRRIHEARRPSSSRTVQGQRLRKTFPP